MAELEGTQHLFGFWQSPHILGRYNCRDTHGPSRTRDALIRNTLRQSCPFYANYKIYSIRLHGVLPITINIQANTYPHFVRQHTQLVSVLNLAPNPIATDASVECSTLSILAKSQRAEFLASMCGFCLPFRKANSARFRALRPRTDGGILTRDIHCAYCVYVGGQKKHI